MHRWFGSRNTRQPWLPPDARAHEYDELAVRYVGTQFADDFVGIELPPDVVPLYPSHRLPLIS